MKKIKKPKNLKQLQQKNPTIREEDLLPWLEYYKKKLDYAEVQNNVLLGSAYTGAIIFIEEFLGIQKEKKTGGNYP